MRYDDEQDIDYSDYIEIEHYEPTEEELDEMEQEKTERYWERHG